MADYTRELKTKCRNDWRNSMAGRLLLGLAEVGVKVGEQRDRYDDALNTTHAAVEECILLENVAFPTASFAVSTNSLGTSNLPQRTIPFPRRSSIETWEKDLRTPAHDP